LSYAPPFQSGEPPFSFFFSYNEPVRHFSTASGDLPQRVLLDCCPSPHIPTWFLNSLSRFSHSDGSKYCAIPREKDSFNPPVHLGHLLSFPPPFHRYSRRFAVTSTPSRREATRFRAEVGRNSSLPAQDAPSLIFPLFPFASDCDPSTQPRVLRLPPTRLPPLG